MAEYPYLRFFNGTENELNLQEDLTTGVLTGTIFLPEVSSGLYESANLFILEEQEDSLGNTIWGTPISGTGATGGTQFKIEWVEEVYASKDIIFYTSQLEDNVVKVQELDAMYIDTLDHTNVISVDSSGLKQVSDYVNTAMQVNIALNSKDEGRHDRKLRITDTSDNSTVAEILVYGETVGEDERLRDLLQNFGATLDDGDFIMFKEHDINEYGIDWKLMNRKRKELLLELHNIKPFVGTYKAVLNAIDFFGYNNITLKEYWLNINQDSGSFGKLQAVPVPDTNTGFSYKKRKKFNLPSSNLKKTSRFSLVYKLNNPTGEFDQWDIPEVEEVFDFTPEEVLIKLYGLKNKLQRDYLPLQAKIVDITGEGDFFDQKNINVWNNQEPIATFNQGKEVSFKLLPENKQIYIEDYSLMTDTNILIGATGHSNIGLEEFDTISQSDRETLVTEFENFYSNYYEEDKDTFNNNLLGYYNIPVGAPVVLECTSLPQTWDDATFTWGDAIDPQINWNNWWHRQVYELEWTIEGPNGYSQTFSGDIGYWETNGLPSPNEVLTYHHEMLKIAFIVPYSGKYSVKLKLTDLCGFVSFYKENDFIDVSVKPLELYGIYQWKEDTKWRKWKTSWEDTGGYWDLPTENQQKIQDSFQSLYLTMDRSNYLNDDSQGKRFSLVQRFIDSDPANLTGFSETTGPYIWDEFDDARWNDGKHTWWNSTRIGPDMTASFKISDVYQGNVLHITHFDRVSKETEQGYYTITSATPTGPTDLAGWQAIADELNASTDEVISKFNYNPVFEDTDNDGTNDVCNFILCVGKNYSYNYDFETVSLDIGSAATEGIIIGELHYTSYNPTFDNVRIINGSAEIERLTHVTISVDKSQMPGIKNPVWKIYKDTNSDYSDIYYDSMWMPYLFKDPGSYRISLEVQDSNGNVNTIERNMIKVK